MDTKKIKSREGVPSSVYKHPDKTGAGASKRRAAKLNQKQYIEADMHEFKHGTLRSGSGAKVKSRQQALKIAFEESRR